MMHLGTDGGGGRTAGPGETKITKSGTKIKKRSAPLRAGRTKKQVPLPGVPSGGSTKK